MLYFILAILVVMADQIVKYLTTIQFGLGGHLDLIPNVLRITYVRNPGIAFSFLADKSWAPTVITVVTIIAALAIIVIMIKAKISAFGKVSLAFVLGGAVGNILDRLILGYVVDMIEPRFINFAVFNVADIFICVGGAMLIIYLIFMYRPEKGEVKVPATAQDKKVSRKVSKYGPDVDESTLVIPIEQIKLASEQAEANKARAEGVRTEQIPPKKTPDVPEPVVTKTTDDNYTFDVDMNLPIDHEFSLEEIMKEFGHDDF